MKNIVVDLGNSRIKVGRFSDQTLIETLTPSSEEELASILQAPHDNLLLSSVTKYVAQYMSAAGTLGRKLELNASLPLPVRIQYLTPNTLGVDRIADACGATVLFPGEDCLVIDLGTCINYELVDRHQNYLGGIISPGLTMRFKAMHTFTARLPLLEASPRPALIGNSTDSCMQSGVVNGMTEEMNGIIAQTKRQYPQLKVILTGGDCALFENQLKHSIFAAPELVLVGLNRILMHNVSL